MTRTLLCLILYKCDKSGLWSESCQIWCKENISVNCLFALFFNCCMFRKKCKKSFAVPCSLFLCLWFRSFALLSVFRQNMGRSVVCSFRLIEHTSACIHGSIHAIKNFSIFYMTHSDAYFITLYDLKWKLFHIALISLLSSPNHTRRPQIVMSHNCFQLGIRHNLDLSGCAHNRSGFHNV